MVGRTYHLVTQNCLLRVFHLMIIGVALVLLLVSHNPIHQLSLFQTGLILHYGPISLVHLAVSEHIVQSAERLGSLGKNNKS